MSELFCVRCSAKGTVGFRKVRWMSGTALLCPDCANAVEAEEKAQSKPCCGGDCAKCKNNPAHVR